jgi:DNA polymerase-3 subunit beta
MIFTCESKELRRAIDKVKTAVPKKSTLPVLETARFDCQDGTLVIEATDLELMLSVDVGVNMDRAGRYNIPLRALANTLPKKGLVMIEADDEETVVAHGSATRSFPFVEKGEDFPEFPELMPSMTMDCRDAVNKCLPFVSTEDTRHVLESVYLVGNGDLTCVATDGRTLKKVVVEADLKEEFSMIVPSRAAGILGTMRFDGEVSFGLSEEEAVFQVDGLRMATRLIDQPYPDYQAIIDVTRSDVYATVNRVDLQEKVKEVSQGLNFRRLYPGPTITVKSKGASLELTAKSEDGSSVVNIPAGCYGKLHLLVNPTLFLRVLNSMDSEIIKVQTAEMGPKDEFCLTPVTLSGDDDPNQAVVFMPKKE